MSRNTVQDTNNSSIVSKLSTCKAGYVFDEYIKHFVQKPARRAPLIHRGYYIRLKAIDHIQHVFLEQYLGSFVQLISLGAGFDTCIFRLHSKGSLYNCRVFEVDFHSVLQQKLQVVANNQQLLKCTDKLKSLDSNVFISEKYCAVCCDINNLNILQKRLMTAGVDFNAPTLLLSECALTYVETTSVNAVIAWVATSFSNAIFCSYEQIHPDDTFGQIMLKHFDRLNSPLKNIMIYPTEESQKKRYISAGWDACRSCDMNTFFNFLPKKEQERVKNLEPFDEYEEWHLKCSHYSILCAFRGSSIQLADHILPCSKMYGTPPYTNSYSYQFSIEDRSISTCCLKRYGHGSCVLADGQLVVIGGYGELSTVTSAPHSRLNDVIKIDTNEWKINVLETQGTSPGKILHHTVTAIAGGTKLLVIGGRGSPTQPNSSIFLLEFNQPQSTTPLWSKILLHPEASRMKPCWRHTATCINFNGEDECVLIVGGSCTTNNALADIYMLNTVTWGLEKLCVSLPEGRCSHSSTMWHSGLIIIGGMNSSLQPLSSCQYLTRSVSSDWEISNLKISPPLPPKYSMAAVGVKDNIVLLGGVGPQRSPDIIILNLRFQQWFGAMISSVGGDVLLHKHTCHLVGNQKLLVIGGGGNCFSFGTHLNSGLFTIKAAPLFEFPWFQII